MPLPKEVCPKTDPLTIKALKDQGFFWVMKRSGPWMLTSSLPKSINQVTHVLPLITPDLETLDKHTKALGDSTRDIKGILEDGAVLSTDGSLLAKKDDPVYTMSQFDQFMERLEKDTIIFERGVNLWAKYRLFGENFTTKGKYGFFFIINSQLVDKMSSHHGRWKIDLPTADKTQDVFSGTLERLVTKIHDHYQIRDRVSSSLIVRSVVTNLIEESIATTSTTRPN